VWQCPGKLAYRTSSAVPRKAPRGWFLNLEYRDIGASNALALFAAYHDFYPVRPIAVKALVSRVTGNLKSHMDFENGG
jgi:hypothetical protein